MNVKLEGTPVRTKPWVPTFLSSEEFGELEKEYVLNVLNKKRVFRFIHDGIEESESAKLETLYKERTGSKYALAVNSGTSALVSALIGAGVGPGDEVIIPGYTYIATAAAVLIARAVPVIVEVDETLTIDPQSIKDAITPYTKAVIPVHMRGIPCQMDEIMEIAREHNLIVIEDVAQANGGKYKGQALGAIGDVGCFSFQQYKVVTAGEGGLLLTNQPNIHARASMYHDCAVSFWGVDSAEKVETFAGENYRMSEIQAAVGLAQSSRIDDVVRRLQKMKQYMLQGIESIPLLQMQRIPDPQGDVSYCLIFYLADSEKAETFSKLLAAEGIPNGAYYNKGFADRHIYANWDYVMEKRGSSVQDTPWNCQSYKGNVEYSKDMCPNTLGWLGRAISISLHQSMSLEDCDDAIKAIKKVSDYMMK